MAEPNTHQVTPPPLPPQVSYTPSYLEEKAIEFGPASPIDAGAEIYKIWGDFIGSGIQFTETLEKLEFERQRWKLEKQDKDIRETAERERVEEQMRMIKASLNTDPSSYAWDLLFGWVNSLRTPQP